MGRRREVAVQSREDVALQKVEDAYLNDALTIDEYTAEKRKVYEGTSRFLPAAPEQREDFIAALMDGKDWAVHKAVKIGIWIVAAIVIIGIVLSIIGAIAGVGGGFEGMEIDD